MTKAAVVAQKATWGDRVAQYSKTIVATVTPAIALATSLGATLPAEQAAPITVGVAAATGFLTWLVANTKLLQDNAIAVENVAEQITGRDL